VMLDRFADPTAGGFFYTADDHDSRVLRSKNPSSGGNMPSPNGVAARVLMRLGKLTGDAQYAATGYRTLRAFAGLMKDQPYAADDLLVVLDDYLNDPALREQAAEAGGPTDHAVVTASIDAPAQVAPGESFDVTVTIDVAEGYHIYGPSVAGSGVSPTRLALLAPTATFQQVQFPEPTTMTDPATGRDVPVYRGRVAVTATLKLDDEASADAPAGDRPITLRLTAQPCDARACYQPAAIDLPIDISRK